MNAKRSIIPIFVPHLGCPNDCVFCDQRKISGSLTQPTAETVRSIVSEALTKIPAGGEIQPSFYGGSFTAIPPEKQLELLGAALPFLRSGAVSSLRVSTRPDAIDSEVLARLKQFGVKTIELGAQSMCDEVLELSGRGHSAAQVAEASKMVKAAGFELILQMMTGLPGDTKARTIKTAEQLIALAPAGVRIYPTVIIENTKLCQMWRAGTYAEHTVEQAVDRCAAVLPMFEAAKIPIIRLGLNPTEELSHGAALGGAYHPALGELVRSRVFLEKARALLKDASPGERLTLGVNPSEVSIMIGQHRENVLTLCRELGLKDLSVRKAAVERGSILLL
ncbi:MAG: radical SAM protein [Oscillospiraceae bacterium]